MLKSEIDPITYNTLISRSLERSFALSGISSLINKIPLLKAFVKNTQLFGEHILSEFSLDTFRPPGKDVFERNINSTLLAGDPVDMEVFCFSLKDMSEEEIRIKIQEYEEKGIIIYDKEQDMVRIKNLDMAKQFFYNCKAQERSHRRPQV